MGAGGRHGLRARAVELGHRLDDGAKLPFGGLPYLVGGAEQAGAQGLGEVEEVARLCTGVAHGAGGVCKPKDAQAVLGLGVVDGVAAADARAGCRHRVCPAAQYLARDIRAQGAVQGQHVEGHHRARAHGEDVAQGVGGGDAPEVIGVVYQRGEEVHREHGGAVVPQAVDGGVVARLKAQQQVGVYGSLDGGEYALEVARTPLGGSTPLGGELREPHALLVRHGPSPLR